MNSVDLVFTSALAQAELIRSKAVSPLELVEIYCQRIQTLDHQLGSYFTVMTEQALTLAKAQTEHLAQVKDPAELPLLFGVSISIKDLHPVAGVACTYGNQGLKNELATHDQEVVKRIKQAGLIILGKTATSEVGSLPYTEPPGFPPTRNPWNLEYTPGGSSGGAAAATAAGLCALALGSDGGGSIRGPAACCGLVGIKPSRGRVSFAPVGDRLSGIAVIGPLARTVADAAALLDVIAGYVTGDPYWLSPPQPSFLAATTQPLSPLKIGFATTLAGFDPVAPECQQGVETIVKLLAELGHTIVDTSFPDFTDLIAPFTTVWQSGVAASGIPAALLQPMNRWLLSQTATAGEYLKAVAQMQIIARRIVAFFDLVDVLVLPVYTHQPIKIGEWANLSPEQTLQRIISWVAPCPSFNASGQPALTIPAGFDANGLPIGVQLVGRPAAEATLITLAAQLEAAQPWSQNQPEFSFTK